MQNVCFSWADEKIDLQNTLAHAAESLFTNQSILKLAGSAIDLDINSLFYELRKEPNQPYRKDSPEYNRRGAWRLIPKK